MDGYDWQIYPLQSLLAKLLIAIRVVIVSFIPKKILPKPSSVFLTVTPTIRLLMDPMFVMLMIKVSIMWPVLSSGFTQLIKQQFRNWS